jgi:hypothetical protein
MNNAKINKERFGLPGFPANVAVCLPVVLSSSRKIIGFSMIKTV